MQTLSNVLKWILVSSADPGRWSMTVKMSLLGLIPFVLQAIGVTCGLHLICPAIGADELQNAALSASNAVFYALSLVSVLGALYGFGRKVYRTVVGTNAAFTPNQ